jgi:hypothetical protein
MSWFSKLNTIMVDIEKGFLLAAPVLGSFVPSLGLALGEIGTIINALEQASRANPSAPVPTQAKLRGLVVAVAVKNASSQAINNSTKNIIKK